MPGYHKGRKKAARKVMVDVSLRPKRKPDDLVKNKKVSPVMVDLIRKIWHFWAEGGGEAQQG